MNYVVKNLPDVNNLRFANVHLLCRAYSPDIKVYGFDQILDKFVSEMKCLSTSGFIGDFPIIGNRHFHRSRMRILRILKIFRNYEF